MKSMVPEQLQRELDKITALKKRLDGTRPLTGTALKKLKEYIDVEWTYNSNAIEGNSLSLAETRVVILDGVTIGGKSVREHLEAINHKKAIDFLEGLIKSGGALIEENILSLHRLVLQGINDPEAGKYRSIAVYISGSRHRPPEAASVPILMKSFLEEFPRKGATLHPALLAAEAHYGISSIHPFVDGNGRTSRLVMNMILMSRGYPPAIIPLVRRSEYIEALEAADVRKDMIPFHTIVVETVERALAQYLQALG